MDVNTPNDNPRSVLVRLLCCCVAFNEYPVYMWPFVKGFSRPQCLIDYFQKRNQVKAPREQREQMQNETLKTPVSLEIDSDDYDEAKKVEVQRSRHRKCKRCHVLLFDENGDSTSDSEWCKMTDEQQEQATEENETSDNSPPPTCSN